MLSYYKIWAKTSHLDPNKATDTDPFRVHLLPYHSMDVAACLKVLLEREPFYLNLLSNVLLLNKKEIVRILTFMHSMHDFGKFAPDFQAKSPAALKKLDIDPYEPKNEFPLRHDVAFHYLFRDRAWKVMDNEGILRADDPELLFNFMVSFTGHHGYPTPFLKWSSHRERYNKNSAVAQVRRQFSGQNFEALISLAHSFKELWGPVNVELIPSEDADTFNIATWLIAGLGTQADWLGSNMNFFEYVSETMPLEKYWEEYALPSAKKAVKASGTLSVPTKKVSSRYKHILPQNATLRPLQKWADEVDIKRGSNLVIIEDAPGSGKTEAALALAREFINIGNAQGIYFALPTQASSNAMFDRIRLFCEGLFDQNNPGSLTLSHGAAKLSESFLEVKFGADDHVECARWLADGRKKALLSQIGVGTIDQALISIMPKYHSNLRMLGLSKKVLVIDEVHAYEEYQNLLLDRLLGFCGKLSIPTILLSATLPQSLRQRFVSAYASGKNLDQKVDENSGYPLGTYFNVQNGSTSLRENQTKAHRQRSYFLSTIEDTFEAEYHKRKWTFAEDEAVHQIVNITKKGQCVVWFRNTVTDVLLAYNKLSAIIDPENIILAHSRFIRYQRNEIDQKAEKIFGKKGDASQRKGKIIICTQVFQESLDLDFDFAISDLAEVDVLLQRFGRVRRHARRLDGSLIEDGSPDERGDGPVPITILMPQYKRNPSEDWYKKMCFRSTSFVYRDVVRMWNTAKLVKEQPIWSLPQDVRHLIESVYGPSIEKPEALMNAWKNVQESRATERTLARENSFRHLEGYHDSTKIWTIDREDKGCPTRLGPPTIVWRLSRYDKNNDSIVPFKSSGSKNVWSENQLNLRKNILSHVFLPEEIEEALERQLNMKRGTESLQDLPWVRYLIVQKNEKDQWYANGVDDLEKPVFITYSQKRGLEYQKLG